MQLQQVISYGEAWKTLAEKYPLELAGIRSVISGLTADSIMAAQPLRGYSFSNEPGVTRYRLDGYWSVALLSQGWTPSESAVRGVGVRPIHMTGLGHLKGLVSVVFQRHREITNRWLYTLAPIATRNGLIEIPIAVVMSARDDEILFGRRPGSMSLLERTKEELVALAPLSHTNPFLLLGIGSDDLELDVLELPSDETGMGRDVIINRSIEFPPEYHQAGLGILSYFGTVLREKYPNHNAKVRIEQDGLRVRLVIESENGDREVIEKALQEYELVVRGETPPEKFFENPVKVLELKNELRIAQVRIETQKDLIAYQGQEIASLRQLFGHALSAGMGRSLAI